MKLYAGGYLTFYMPQKAHSLDFSLDEPRLLSEILMDLAVPLAEVYLVAVNGEVRELEDTIVKNSDDVRIYSSVNGG